MRDPSARDPLPTLGWLRALLRLERAEASGSLRISAHGRSASIRLARGAVVGFEGELGPRLGELLGTARDTHGDAEHAYGARALASGRVSRNELAWALRRQLRSRARELARWGEVSTRWEPGVAIARPFTDPMSVADLVAEVLRSFAESLRAEASTHSATGVSSPLALAWAERAALFPHELAAARGEVRGAAGARFARALAAAGLLDVPPADDVRALTQLHARVRREGARAVLGAAGEIGERRRALRRVAAMVHPDRFAHDPRLGRISEELVASLASS